MLFLNIIGAMLLGVILLACLYPLLLAAMVLVPLGLVVIGLFVLNAGNWMLAAACIALGAGLMSLWDLQIKDKHAGGNAGEDENKYLAALRAKSKKWNDFATKEH